jgi:hypothetical protein
MLPALLSMANPGAPVIAKETFIRPKVMADMFAHYLGTRLGGEQDIVDYYTKGPFKDIEQGENLVSPGKDKTVGTDDDVVLGQFCK